MAYSEQVLFLTTYVKNGKVISGSFPVTVGGYITCHEPVSLTPTQKAFILSEKLDPNQIPQSSINSLDGNPKTTLDGTSNLISLGSPPIPTAVSVVPSNPVEIVITDPDWPPVPNPP